VPFLLHQSIRLDHRFSNLVGHSDNNASEDAGRLHVTFHHNWWGQLVHERMPRVRFGRVHVYNNFYNSPGNNYCIRAAGSRKSWWRTTTSTA
jgi:pectate lyase